MLDDPLIVVAQLAHIFDDMAVAYLVGGSFASSLYGIPRATQDVDIMADLGILHAEPLAKLLEKEFYYLERWAAALNLVELLSRARMAESSM